MVTPEASERKARWTFNKKHSWMRLILCHRFIDSISTFFFVHAESMVSCNTSLSPLWPLTTAFAEALNTAHRHTKSPEPVAVQRPGSSLCTILSL